MAVADRSVRDCWWFWSTGEQLRWRAVRRALVSFSSNVYGMAAQSSGQSALLLYVVWRS